MSNNVSSGDYGGYGGGIYSAVGEVLLDGCTVTANSVYSSGYFSSIYSYGGGIYVEDGI